jgi:tetratricopeptide (TPR) repeat protein
MAPSANVPSLLARALGPLSRLSANLLCTQLAGFLNAIATSGGAAAAGGLSSPDGWTIAAVAGLLGVTEAWNSTSEREKAQALAARLKALADEQGTAVELLNKIADGEYGLTLDWFTQEELKERIIAGLASAGLATSGQVAEIEQRGRDHTIYLETLDQMLREVLNHLEQGRGGITPAQLDEIVERHVRAKVQLEQRVAVSEQEKAQLKVQLDAALCRVQTEADLGDQPAKAAIEEARKTGDVTQLQAVLVAEADRREPEAEGRVRHATADYVELAREIVAIAYLRGDIAEAERRLDTILRFLPNDLDALNRRGHIHRLRGNLPGAEQDYRRVAELAENDEGRAVAYGNLGAIYQTRGDLDEAERLHRKALEIEVKLGRLEGMASTYGNLGLIYQTRGDLDEAERLLRKALEINEKLGRLEGMASTYGNLGVIYRARGDLDEAERWVRKSLEIDEKLGQLEGMANAYCNLGVIYGTRGDLDEAERLFRKSLEINEKFGRLEGMANAYCNLGLIYATRGDLDEAERLFRKALELDEKLGRLEGMAKQYGNLGLIYATRGDLAGARELWTKAGDLFGRIGMPQDVAKAQALIDGLPKP